MGKSEGRRVRITKRCRNDSAATDSPYYICVFQDAEHTCRSGIFIRSSVEDIKDEVAKMRCKSATVYGIAPEKLIAVLTYSTDKGQRDPYGWVLTPREQRELLNGIKIIREEQ